MSKVNKSTHCNKPDVDEPGLECGYPLPCPHHTAVINEDELFGKTISVGPALCLHTILVHGVGVRCQERKPCPDHTKVVEEKEQELTVVQKLIKEVCDDLAKMLIEKNRKYGNSALNPVRIFSKADPVEQIKVRMDDKLSRIQSAQGDDDEDPKHDLMGYLILEEVGKRLKMEKEDETD